MKVKVYLAGLISTECPESLSWRSDVVAFMQPRTDVVFLDPLAGKSDLTDVSPDGGLNYPDLSAQDIILRDLRMVARSDVILANLNSYGSLRPMIGTWFELGWAWDRKIPIVAFAEPGTGARELAENHPFLRATVSHLFNLWSDAVRHAVDYYGG